MKIKSVKSKAYIDIQDKMFHMTAITIGTSVWNSVSSSLEYRTIMQTASAEDNTISIIAEERLPSCHA